MKRILLLAAWAVIATSDDAFAGNWPQWRGPNNDGVSNETNLATKWSDKENILWKLKLPGMGSATPAIWGDKIFVPTQDGADLSLLCIDKKKGEVIWKAKIGTGKHTYQANEGNDASPSPSTDGNHVFTMVGTGQVTCVDFDGKEIWSFDAQKRYGKFDIQFGMHSTPVLFGDKLYLQLLHSKGNIVVAIEAATGKDVWKIDRKSDGRAECEQSYASPCIWSKGKDAYLITHGNDYTIAHDLKDGSEIWRLGDLNPAAKYNPTLRFVASPVATADLIVVPTAKSGPVVGVKPDAKGKIMIGGEGEQWRMARDTPDVPSPLVQDGLVYLCRESGGRLTCLDAKTGAKIYTDEKMHSARYRTSPVYGDGKIYLADRDGVVSVVKAGKKFELLASNKFPEDITASPAISDGVIFIRGWENLYAIAKAK